MKVTETVISILKEISGKETINEADGLKNDIALDSLQLVAILVKIEDAFAIQLSESDMNPFDLATVSDVVKLVEKYS